MREAIDRNKKEPEIDIGLNSDFGPVVGAVEVVGVRPDRLAIANDIERQHAVRRHASGGCRASETES